LWETVALLLLSGAHGGVSVRRMSEPEQARYAVRTPMLLWLVTGGLVGVLLFLIAPMIQKLMHGVK